jgi:alpha-beta hydrolase superfamily lysophospholipase
MESPPQWVEPETKGEARLALDLIPAATPSSRLWFFVHGLTSHRRGEKALYFARQVVRRGEAFASLDLTGHGESEGDLLDLSAGTSEIRVWAALRREKPDRSPRSTWWPVDGRLTAPGTRSSVRKIIHPPHRPRVRAGQ